MRFQAHAVNTIDADDQFHLPIAGCRRHLHDVAGSRDQGRGCESSREGLARSGGISLGHRKIARQLHAHLPAGEIVNLLEGRVANCGRAVSRAEIISAVQDSLPCAWQPNGSSAPVRSAAKWPVVNQEQREAIVGDGGGLADLWELSQPRIEDNAQHTEEIIDRLFPGNPLLCCGKSSQEFDTRPREDWRGELSALALIVPSPMSAPLGRKKNPKLGESEWSAHTLDNTGARRFLICEFDTGTADEHAAILIHLAVLTA